MAQFSIKANHVQTVIDAEAKLVGDLQTLENETQKIGDSLGFQIAAAAGLKNRLNRITGQISACGHSMNGMRSALQNVYHTYERTEQAILGAPYGGAPGFLSTLDHSSPASKTSDLKKLSTYLDKMLNGYDNDAFGDLWYARMQDMYYYVKMIHEYDDFFETQGRLLCGLPAIFMQNGEACGEFLDNIKNSIAEKSGFKAHAEAKGSLYENQISGEHGSLGVHVGAYQAYADASGALFEKDEDGNPVFAPHIEAKMGAGFTAAEVVGTYAVGNEWLGAKADGHITAGKVSGEVDASAGLMGDDGSFDPHASVNASAEAILVDAKAQGGVTVLGTEAKASASVNVGIGAHANVSIGGGKIECDLGASVGLGLSFSVSIDYEGTLKAVKKAAKGMAKSVLSKLKIW